MAKAFDEAVQKIRCALRHAYSTESAEDKEWLRSMYVERCERFKHDNSTIWVTGSIMIPVSFAAVAVPIQNCVSNGWTFIFLAAGSFLLLGYWVVIAETHRALQTKSHAFIAAIEQEFLGFDDPVPEKLVTGACSKYLSAYVREARIAILAIWAPGWFALWYFLAPKVCS